ncbi:MAG: nitrate reductase associated protein [Cyanobacteria bacterium J06638_7]
MHQHNHCFAFEADFVAELRCLPMAVRRKLDLAGIKLRLQQWNALAVEERSRLLAWGDDPAAIAALAHWLLKRSAELPHGPASTMAPAAATAWQQNQAAPEVLLRSCAELGLRWRAERWRELAELQRFALVKLSHPGHEHRNLPPALAEFQLLA